MSPWNRGLERPSVILSFSAGLAKLFYTKTGLGWDLACGFGHSFPIVSAVVLQCLHGSVSPGRLVLIGFWALPSRLCFSRSGESPRTYFSNEFPGDAAADSAPGQLLYKPASLSCPQEWCQGWRLKFLHEITQPISDGIGASIKILFILKVHMKFWLCPGCHKPVV